MSASRAVLVLDGAPHAGPAEVRVRAYARGRRDGAPVLADSGTRLDPAAIALAVHPGPVSVVVCGAALDIERLASDGLAATPIGWWQRWRWQHRRRRDGAGATVAWLGRHGCSEARAALQRDVTTPEWIERLQPLARAGLSIGSVSLPERLLAADHPRRAVPRFTFVQEAAHARHVLVIDGAVCFARRVPMLPGASCAPLRDIAESLAHALDRWSVRRVALDLGELPGEVAEAVEPAMHGLSARVEILRAPGTRAPGESIARLAAGTAVRRAGSEVLAPLCSDWRERTERRRLERGVVLGAIASLLIAAQAATVGRDSLRSARALSVQQARVAASLQLTIKRAEALHAEPERAAHYLDDFAALGSTDAGDPTRLLSAIARAVTRHEAIVLDALAWSHRSIDAPTELDDAVYTDAADLPVAHRSDAHRLALELSGRVVAAGALREAQGALEDFIVELQAQAALSACQSLASPLSTAAAGGAAAAAQGQPGWHVRCPIEHPA